MKEIEFNNTTYKITTPPTKQKFLGIETEIVTIPQNIKLFWNALRWEWCPLADIKREESKFHNKVKDIYFKDTTFLVLKSALRKDILNDEIVDIATLPIGIKVYWSKEDNEWKYWGGK